MAKKTWIYIGVAAGILVAAYLMFRPSGSSLLGSGTPATSGTAGTIDASGRLVGALGKAWSAIFGGGSSSDGSLSTNFSGDYYLDREVG